MPRQVVDSARHARFLPPYLRLAVAVAALAMAACAGTPAAGVTKDAAVADVEVATAEVQPADAAAGADAVDTATRLDDSETTTPDAPLGEADLPTPGEVADGAVPGSDLPDADAGPAATDAGVDATAVAADAVVAPDLPDAVVSEVVLADADSQGADAVPEDVLTAPVMPATLPAAAFTNVTASFGLDPAKNHAPCVAVADFDGNGREDFVVVETAGTKATVHAILLGPGPPVHVYSAFDTTVVQPNFGCTGVDMDGDAKPDLLFGGYSGAAIYAGDGKGGFVDDSAAWMPFVSDFTAFSVSPVDLDGDADLDLFVGAGFDPPPCTSLKCQFTASDLVCVVDPPLKLTPQLQDRVLIQGAQLPLTDQTAAWKVPPGGTQTVGLALDVDSDGKMDMLVGDDMGSHRLLHNTGGSFKSYDTDIGFHTYAGAMGWGVGDFNGDGLFDLVLAESGPTPMYVQTPAKAGKPLQFLDKGGELGVWWPTWGSSAWAPLVADFDHDGLDDLQLGISVNFTPEKAADFSTVCDESKFDPNKNPFAGETSIDVLFLHGPGKAMTAQAMPAGEFSHVVLLDPRYLDLDDDGDLDVVQTRPGPTMMPVSRVRILRNDLVKKGKSIRVVVKGKGKNQDALGTTITAKIGGQVRKRWLNGSGSWGGTPTRFAHFGLGSSEKATEVTVTWPDGTKTVLGDVVPGVTKSAVWK